MNLTELLSPQCLRVPLNATTKDGAIAELVDVLAEQGMIHDRQAVLQAVMDREETASTGIGHGLAVPHGKCVGCNGLAMAIGKPAKPLDFNSRDGKPVDIIVLLASPPDKTGPHIQALARVSRLMLLESFRTEMLTAGNAEQLWNTIRKHEGS